MDDPLLDSVLPGRKIVGLFLIQLLGKDMVKDFRAEGFQQVVFRLKVGVKGRPADVGFIDDFLNGNMPVSLMFQ